MKIDIENQVNISDEEYSMLESILERGCLWLVRDEDNGLWAFEDEPYKYTSTACWDSEGIGVMYDVYDHTKFKFVKWEDDEPHYIPALIQDYDMEQIKKGEDNMYTNQKHYTPVEEDNSGTGELKYCSVFFPYHGDKVEDLHKDYDMEDGHNVYHYFTDIEGLTYGDVVAVPTSTGVRLAAFVGYLNKSDKARSIVLNKIDVQRGKDFYRVRKEQEDLENKIKARVENLGFMEQAARLAQNDPTMQQLLETYNRKFS